MVLTDDTNGFIPMHFTPNTTHTIRGNWILPRTIPLEVSTTVTTDHWTGKEWDVQGTGPRSSSTVLKGD